MELWQTVLAGLGSFIAGVTISLGSFSMLVGIHDYGMPEDSRVVWVCSYHGNGVCGPQTPQVQVDLSKLREW